MLLTLLMAISSATFLMSALLTVRNDDPTLGRYGLALFVGALLAASNAWAVYRAGLLLADRSASWPQTRQELVGKAFFLVILLWLPVAALIGKLITMAVTQLVA
jgi:hypothetical protein